MHIVDFYFEMLAVFEFDGSKNNENVHVNGGTFSMASACNV